MVIRSRRCPLQIIHVTVKQFHGLVNQRLALRDYRRRQQTFIARCCEVIQDFPARSPRVAAKLCVIEVMKPSVSFGDISRCGARRAQQLFSQAISLLLGQRWNSFFRNKYPKLSAFSPALKVLKCFDLRRLRNRRYFVARKVLLRHPDNL